MTLAGNLRENKAVHTVAGAGDFAVEKLREMPEQMNRAREAAEKYQGEVRETVYRYGGQFRETVERYRGEVQGRVDAKDLPGAAVEYATTFGTRAAGFIDELAERGRKVVQREAAEVAEIAEAKPRTRTAPKRTAQRKTTAKKTGS
ncbi:hypothetical protein BJF79_26980 [Actinomadura sp. CNU-125]|uniref:hypothetical protein n=1 Tax=Actinomadura sp. CNU-125 TaxID=1904961 RepID=UPI000967957E|nr:hypothetical protein [Actinomadura sp. CNU-125]OLT38423.1 hypothetical protein BJF79_26980 [Actinomadura sp. CNU-125]